jgi:3-methyladenine DNA glycosylase AlkD
MRASEIVERLKALGSPERERVCRSFFKTGPGQYGEGDVFAGLTVPQVRALAKELRALPRDETVRLLHSLLHEARLLALLLLIQAYAEGGEAERMSIYSLYLKNTRWINNWDLVDVSAEHIVGAHLYTRDRSALDSLADSKLLWERRIAILATFHFIRRGEFADTLRIAERLVCDREDLMHKAVGWMLREVGKRDLAAEEAFLIKHARTLPRTMLRYAIERFPEELRQRYLRGSRGNHDRQQGGRGDGMPPHR